jgi:hypothetical protein
LRIAALARGPSDSFDEWVGFTRGGVVAGLGCVGVSAAIAFGWDVHCFFSRFASDGVVASLHVLEFGVFDVPNCRVCKRCRCVVGVESQSVCPTVVARSCVAVACWLLAHTFRRLGSRVTK